MAELTVTPRPAKGLLAIVLVFALGAVFGAALSVVLVRALAWPRPFGPPLRGGRGPMGIARMERDLDLDPAQRERVRAIVERSHGEVGAILERTHEEIRGLLRADQQERFDRLPHGRRHRRD